ncbi:hypothetical protein HF521_008550 [Silurus meridionalis]|uniref:TGF-beta family profile domain-containing protein n=1 Tax=Silurus meridionalis TaxID=175797 RepID=A0A8T0AN30_SILME|nr:hypothetical protein HF521_008550 [Silurus meridionalis]
MTRYQISTTRISAYEVSAYTLNGMTRYQISTYPNADIPDEPPRTVQVTLLELLPQVQVTLLVFLPWVSLLELLPLVPLLELLPQVLLPPKQNLFAFNKALLKDLDFEAFGWDWIIAPKRYKANYCSGQCEYMFMQKYPHTHLVQHANPRGSAGPCCTPTKMSPIIMLYFDDKQQIIHGKIPGMVVDRCDCS